MQVKTYSIENMEYMRDKCIRRNIQEIGAGFPFGKRIIRLLKSYFLAVSLIHTKHMFMKSMNIG